MIHLGVRTEYSFKKAYAPLDSIIELEGDAIGIADDDNTYGHIPFIKKARLKGKKPILGVRLTVVKELRERFKYGGFRVLLLARNNKGLREIYKLVDTAWKQFYYIPRLGIDDFTDMSDNILALNLNYAGKDKELLARFYATALNFNTPDPLLSNPGVYIDDNTFINVQDRNIYELMAGSSKRGEGRNFNFNSEVNPQHILSIDEVRANFGHESISMTDHIASLCDAEIEDAEMVKYSGTATILQSCFMGAIKKDIDLDDPVYSDRFYTELNLIKDKGYDDYFLIVADMITFAKRNGVLVGPSRGSSAGSLVCYLMDITEVDPIPYGLLFNRFIDINRFDLPDIDVDFPDTKREFVIKYLIKKYGRDNVASLANINRFKAKSAIGEFALGLGIPPYETTAVKDSIIERSGGDARAAMCIMDTLEGTEAGKEFIEKYPTMKLVANIEGHASHAGKHAAGIIVSTEPLVNYGGINAREGTIMMDKKDAEEINLLKIDVLGLRTLAILEEACDLIHMPYSDIYTLPLADQPTFDIFNNMRLNGIFQFEGQALRILTKQMGVYEFNDIVSITALARPGALNSGGANRFVKYKTGVETPIYRSEMHRTLTEETMGIVIYQEQMMSMAKEIGNMTWEDVSNLRKAASKSLGDEFFSQFKDKFLEGAEENGINSDDAEHLWGDIAATGSWTFNKSHAVSYGLISYWTAWFKANHPLEFAIANLNHARDNDSAVKFLRDCVQNDNMEYIPVDPDLSGVRWSTHNGKLIGGLLNLDGIGEAKAKKIVKDRESGKTFTPAIFNKLMNPKTHFDILFPTEHYWGHFYNDPKSYGLNSKPSYIEDIDGKGSYILIGKVIERDLRDRNDYQSVVRRGGKKVDKDQYYLKLIIEDDTDSILCMVSHTDFENLQGQRLSESLKPGETWVIIKGSIKSDWRMITINHITNLSEWSNK